MRLRLPAVATDIALLAARVGLGIVLIAHGWQKFNEWGLDGTADSFKAMDVPLPTLSAYFAAIVELVGGIALIAGAATAVVGLLVVVDMAGAFLFVHGDQGVFVGEGGYELVLTIGVAALTLAAVGAGRFSVDGVFSKSNTARTAATRGA